MRAIWTGVVSFGLVTVPVRLYSATANHDIAFHQVHETDGGRIRYKRVCAVCGEEVPYADIVKGFETEVGDLVTLDADDIAGLPVAASRQIEVIEFVPAEQVDPLLLDRSYYLEPDPKAAKPYALLREALREAEQMAVVKVALRQRGRLALLRVRGNTIVMQTILWADEVREPDFETLRTEVELRPQELQMAATLIGSLESDFDPARFDDEYRKAVEELIDHKRQHGGARPTPAAAESGGEAMTDLLTALQRSVEEASSRRGAPVPEQRTGSRSRARKAEPTTARKAPAKKVPAKKAPAEPPAPAKKAGGRSSGTPTRRRATGS